MIRKLAVKLGLCLVLSTLIVAFLSLISHEVKNSKGAFLRAFSQHAIDERIRIELGTNAYYLAGASGNTAFFGNHSAPLHVLSLDCRTGDTLHHTMTVEGVFDQRFWSLRLKVDSPLFYLYDGVVPRIYTGSVCDWKTQRFAYDTEFFQDIELVGKNSFAIRSLMGEEKNAALGKISVNTPHFTFKPGTLTKQVDGVFCTMGYLSFDKKQNKLIYLYRYRNEFMVMDSNLHVLKKGITIDTNSLAKMRVTTIESTGARIFQTPPLIVNKKGVAYGDHLFVNSALISKNEPNDALEKASVIDVYHLNDSKYKFSFYIFDTPKGEKLKDFRVLNNCLIALYETKVQIYDIDSSYFSKE